MRQGHAQVLRYCLLRHPAMPLILLHLAKEYCASKPSVCIPNLRLPLRHAIEFTSGWLEFNQLFFPTSAIPLRCEQPRPPLSLLHPHFVLV